MNIKNATITAFRALLRSKTRSALTSVGIIIGVSSVIILINIGNSAKTAINERIKSFGANSMSIVSEKKQFRGNDLKKFKQLFSNIKYTSPVLGKEVDAIYKNKRNRSKFYAVNNDYFKIKKWNLYKGRFFSNHDYRSNARVIIIGSTNKNKLFASENPIGKTILIDNIPFKVVGLLKRKLKGLKRYDFDETFMIPYTTGLKKIWNLKTFPKMYVTINNSKNIKLTRKSIKNYLRKKHFLRIQDKDDFTITTSKEKLKMANDISGAMTIFLVGVASISLIVGGIGIMNIMLVSVTERTREIGIRMAIGAKRRDILSQFLIESITLSLIGGVIGIILGVVVYYLIIYFLEWPFMFSFEAIILSVFFSSGVGIFFGYYPSRKASRLNPIDALKYE